MKRLKFDLDEICNPVFKPLFFDKNRTFILYGGRASSKSVFASQYIIIDLINQTYSKWISMRRYHADLKDSCYQQLVDTISLMDLEDFFIIHRGNPMRIICKLNGNQIIFRGLDKPAKTKSISNPTGIWMEEADEISEEAYEKTSTSLRGPQGSNIKEIMTFNPEREHAWINKKFFPAKETYEKADGSHTWVKSSMPDTTILHTTYKHNYWCTAKVAKKLENFKFNDDGGNYYKIYTLGLWGGALKGLVYPKWDTYDHELPDGESVYGIDWGYNDPTVLVEVVRKELDIFVKLRYYNSERTTKEFLDEIESDGVHYFKGCSWYSDHEQDRIKEMKMRGYNVRTADKGKDSIRQGIDFIKNFNLKIHVDDRELINELKSYKWNEDRDGVLQDQPVDANNHAMDAMRYAIVSHGRKYGWMRSEESSSSVPSFKSSRKSRVDKYSSY